MLFQKRDHFFGFSLFHCLVPNPKYVNVHALLENLEENVVDVNSLTTALALSGHAFRVILSDSLVVVEYEADLNLGWNPFPETMLSIVNAPDCLVGWTIPL